MSEIRVFSLERHMHGCSILKNSSLVCGWGRIFHYEAVWTNKAGIFEYRTTVHVSFEGEDQRSNPVASWQLWNLVFSLERHMHGCSILKNSSLVCGWGRIFHYEAVYAHEREGLLAVEYIDPSQGDVRNQGHCQVQLEEVIVTFPFLHTA
jgi:hypothetical protein